MKTTNLFNVLANVLLKAMGLITGSIIIFCLYTMLTMASGCSKVAGPELNLYERTLDLTDANKGFTAWKLSKMTFASDTGINDVNWTTATSYLHYSSLDTAYLNNNDDKVW